MTESPQPKIYVWQNWSREGGTARPVGPANENTLVDPIPSPAAYEAELWRTRAALRRERARGRSGHWTYDLTRHLALVHKLRRLEKPLTDRYVTGSEKDAPPVTRRDNADAQRAI